MKSFEMPAERILLYDMYCGRMFENKETIVDNVTYSNINSMKDKSKKVKNIVKKRILVKNNRKFK